MTPSFLPVLNIFMDSGNRAFLSLLLSIGHDLTEEDFENLKFLCQGTVPASRLENISRPRELFLEIIHCCGLSEQNKSPLASLLFHIARHDLRNRLLGIEGKSPHWNCLVEIEFLRTRKKFS